MLVIGGRHDPATPLEWSEQMVAALGNGSYLFESGHFGHGSNAIRPQNRIRDFLLDPSREPDAFSCLQTVPPPQAAEADPIVVSMSATFYPAPAEPVPVTFQVARWPGGEILAEGAGTMPGPAVALSVPTNGEPLRAYYRASADGYRSGESVSTRAVTGNVLPSVTLMSDDYLAALYPTREVDPALGTVLIRARNCDLDPEPSTITLAPPSGTFFHLNHSGGGCASQATATTTDRCGGAFALNVQPGTYSAAFVPTDHPDLRLELDPITMRPGTDLVVGLLP
jgi:hypothetical protein